MLCPYHWLATLNPVQVSDLVIQMVYQPDKQISDIRRPKISRVPRNASELAKLMRDRQGWLSPCNTRKESEVSKNDFKGLQ